MARCWLFDDGLWGSPFRVFDSEGGGWRLHG